MRARLTLIATAVVSLVLGVSAVVVLQIQERVLLNGVKESLAQRADNLAPTLTGAVAELPSEGDREDSFLQLLGPGGRVLASGDNLAGVGPLVRPVRSETYRTVSVRTLSSHDYLVLTRPLGTRTLVLGKNVDDVQDSVRVLTTSLAVAIPVAVLLLAGLLWWLVGRVLRPVEVIRAEVAGIDAGELHRRVPVPHLDDEISRLASTMNAMLERVQLATERQRQFVADASHELRSPITRLRSTVEVALAHPDLEPAATTLAGVATDASQLQDLVSDLLLLARSEPGAPPPQDQAVDLDDLVLHQAARLRGNGLVVDTSGVSAARTGGDPMQLGRVLSNLSDNAVRHARTQVSFLLRESSDDCELVVEDDGPGIPAEHRSRVFDRFARLDDSRSFCDGGGAGLGLAIVHDIVVRHGGTVTVEAAAPTGARVVVRLPRRD